VVVCGVCGFVVCVVCVVVCGLCGVCGCVWLCVVCVCVCGVCLDTAIVVNLIWLNVPRAPTKQNLLTFNLLLMSLILSSIQRITPDRLIRGG